MEGDKLGPGTIQVLPSGVKGEGTVDRTRDKAVMYDQGVPAYNQHYCGITGAGTDSPGLS